MARAKALLERWEWLVLAFFALPLGAVADDPWKNLVHRQWVQDDGLPQGSPTAIVEDHRGYLWITTFGGLARFDGVRFVIFSSRDIPGLVTDRWVDAVIADTSLWLASEEGPLQQLDLSEVWPRAHPPLPVKAGALFPRRAGGVWWVGRESGGWAKGSEVEVLWRRQVGKTEFRAIAELEDGSVAVGALDGLWWSERGGSELRLESRLSGVSVNQILPLQGGQALVAAANGLWLADQTEARPLVGGVWVDRVLRRQSGEIWLALLHQGLWRLKGTQPEPFPASFGLAGARILGLYEDRHGIVWAGTDGSGLYRFSRAQSRSIIVDPGLGVSVRAVELAPDGSFWAALGCRGLARIRDEQVVERAVWEGCVQSLFWTGEELLLGTSESGLFRWVRGRPVPVPSPPPFQRPITSFCRLLDGRILVGGQQGLAFYDGNGLLPISQFAGTQVVSLLCEGARIMMGTATGLWELGEEGGSFQVVRTLEVGAPVRSVLENEDGSWLLATYGRGLMLLERDGRLLSLPPERGVEDAMISGLLELPAGVVWFSGNQGLATVSKAELLRAFREKTPVFPRVLGARAGLPATECNGGNHRSLVRDAANRMLVPTVAGVGVVDIGEHLQEVVAPSVVVEEISEAGRLVALGRNLRFGKNAHNLAVRFTALGAPDREDAIFRWRFANRGGEWEIIGRRRSLFFESLPPGSSHLEVSARTPTSPWGPVATVVLYRQPAFVETVWFYLTLVLSGLALGVAAWVGRTWELQRRARWLEQEVEKRTREREALQRLVETVNEGRRLEDVLERTFEGLRHLIPFDHLCCWLASEQGVQLAWCSVCSQRAEWPGRCVGSLGEQLAWRVAGTAVSRGQSVAELQELCPSGSEKLWLLPLDAFGRHVGFLVFSTSGPSLEPYANILRLVGGQLSVIVEKARLFAELETAKGELENLAVTDELTGLANRRAFGQWLDKEWKSARRLGRPVALILADIDHFKALNDALGHSAGDRCLVEVARVVKGFARRAEDLAARWGGEELVLILPGMDTKRARATAEELRAAVESLKLPHPASPVAPVVTVSLGVASWVPGPGESWELLWSMADMAMYRAKQAGRNRVMDAEQG